MAIITLSIGSRTVALDVEEDPDTLGGYVTTSAMPRAEARELEEDLALAGLAVSWAPDSDDPSRTWLYVVPSRKVAS